MSYAEQMIRTSQSQSQIDQAALAECIRACFDCAQACAACADACLGEQNVQELVRCIRLNLDCADICATKCMRSGNGDTALTGHRRPCWYSLSLARDEIGRGC